ncbi:MAG: response regulator, partial [Ghiorsea sp.]
ETEINRLAEQSHAESAAKTTFLANMSHEIRTPMNGVMGMTEMLQKTHLSAKQEAYVSVIQRSSDALLSIINDILDYSKIESGNLTLDMCPFHLRDIMDEVMGLLAQQGNEKGLEVILEIDPKLGNAFIGDAGRIRQMLINLMGNALKFTQEGEVHVSVVTEVIDEETYWLRFAVCDTGIGIAEHAQQKIFESFSQADNSTTRRFGGTGLGLAICWQLAELMQGELSLESEEGKYSRFSFIIPLKTELLTHAAGEHLLFPHAERQHVLIVEDNRSTRRALCHQLDAWNIKRTAVDSAIEAWRMLTEQGEENPFTQVLLDMHMSGIHGLDLASMIRANNHLSTLRLLMLCGNEKDAEAIKESSIYVDDYLLKPISQARLRQVLSVQEKHPTEAAIVAESSDTFLFSGVRILIAEDNPVNQQVLVAMLELLGCHAEVANNGLEVLSAIESQGFDLILMDCHMPQMDGLEATRQIRAHQGELKNLCIVALTANAMPEDRARCVKAGMDDYLSKPFTQAQLRKVIEKHCSPRVEAREEDGDAELVVSEQLASLSMPEALQQARSPSGLDEESLYQLRVLQQPNGVNILQKVMEMYLEDTPQQLQTMRDALVEHESDRINLAAHSLKSSSANIGALRLSEICFDIECLSDKDWELSSMLTYVEQAEESFHQISQEIMAQHLQEVSA